MTGPPLSVCMHTNRSGIDSLFMPLIRHGLTRLLSGLLCVLAMAFTVGAGAARASSSAPPGTDPVTAYPAAMQVLEGLSAETTIEQVAALDAALFKPLVTSKRYSISVTTPLWLRMAAPMATADGAPWLLEFPTVIVDRYEFYQRDAGGAWCRLVAGDFIAHSQWPADSLRPRFPLAASAAGAPAGDIYVRVVHRLPANLSPLLVQAAEATRRDVAQMLWAGLQVGVIAVLVLFCAQMALAYRDRSYAWYAGYLWFTGLATLCYTGVAQRYLWPQATTFASHATILTVLCSLVFNLQFTRSIFGGLQGRGFHWVARGLIAATVLYIGISPFVVQYDQLVPAFYLLILGIFVFTIACAFRAWRRGVAFGGYWLLVYVPYLGCVALTMADSGALLTLPWLPSATPVAAAMVEAVAMMLCLNAYARLRHAETVRAQAANEHDPLTGFLNQKTFRERATRIWHAAERQGSDVVLVYVTVELADQHHSDTIEAEAMLARSVRLVRTITRQFDLVGRMDRNMLGIVMEGLQPGDALTARLSRLIALGLMHNTDEPLAIPLNFTVAVGSRRQFTGDFSKLDAALQALVHADDGSRRAIRFLNPPSAGVTIPVRRYGEMPRPAPENTVPVPPARG